MFGLCAWYPLCHLVPFEINTRAARATRMWLSGLSFIFTAVMVMGVLASNSRGGFLGMCFATMILALVSLRHLRFGWLLLYCSRIRIDTISRWSGDP